MNERKMTLIEDLAK